MLWRTLFSIAMIDFGCPFYWVQEIHIENKSLFLMFRYALSLSLFCWKKKKFLRFGIWLEWLSCPRRIGRAFQRRLAVDGVNDAVDGVDGVSEEDLLIIWVDIIQLAGGSDWDSPAVGSQNSRSSDLGTLRLTSASSQVFRLFAFVWDLYLLALRLHIWTELCSWLPWLSSLQSAWNGTVQPIPLSNSFSFLPIFLLTWV